MAKGVQIEMEFEFSEIDLTFLIQSLGVKIILSHFCTLFMGAN